MFLCETCKVLCIQNHEDYCTYLCCQVVEEGRCVLSVTLLVEGDNDASRICKPAPYWDIKGYAPMQQLLGNVVFCLTQASKIGGLRGKLNRSNLTEVSFMIVNEREATSRAMYWELKRRAPPGVPVYQQAPLQNDVWDSTSVFICAKEHQFSGYTSIQYCFLKSLSCKTYHVAICILGQSYCVPTQMHYDLSPGQSVIPRDSIAMTRQSSSLQDAPFL
uniref:Selenoprotein P N-terminal domain-containing protein n=1 Tax=Acanthochromis polyacanthus TaxID=80966 RepID=A0A3Q1EWU5_9TELE